MTMSETEQFEVLVEPQEGNPGLAGVGVRYRPNVLPGERVTIEQLWPDGSADSVYIPEDELGDLIYQLMRVHLDVMERGRDA